MANIKSFQAIRPAKGMESLIAALPYDVYNRTEARVYVKEHPSSFLKIDRPETFFEEEKDIYAQEVYARARQELQKMLEDGEFKQDSAAGFYVYELTMDGRSQTGIAACASIDDYLSGVIKKHENTRAEKEADRIRHIHTCNMQTGPVFLAYRSKKQLKTIISKVKEEACSFDFTAEDGIRHRGWTIFDKEIIQQIQDAFAEVKNLYIADGHHRAASAVKVGINRRNENLQSGGENPYDYFLCVLFSEDELKILDYNRVVKDLNGLSSAEFLTRIKETFLVEEEPQPVRPEVKGEIGMYLEETWYRLTIKPEFTVAHPVEGLDVSILQKKVLSSLLGIADPRTDNRIDFVGGIRGLQELERRVSTDCAVAFSLYPTSLEELFAVADADMLMPPKSTWFEPKLRSGLFLHSLEQHPVR